MSDARHFEQRVAAVVYAAERAVTRTEPTPGDGAPLPPAVDAPGPRATGLARRLGARRRRAGLPVDRRWRCAVEPRGGAAPAARCTAASDTARGASASASTRCIAALDADTTRVVLGLAIDPASPADPPPRAGRAA
jgi:hypothetical protein